MRQKIAEGRHAYVVYPRVEDADLRTGAKAVAKEFERLQGVFAPHRVGLLHGRLRPEEKERVMAEFRANRAQVLLATSVIEVGIDVPNATIMIIENAERFGLSQLHQLRGRVGRGADQSYCILIADYAWFDHHRTGLDEFEVQSAKKSAKIRLETMVETTDGFKIAEVDLKLRGPGEFFGTRQSGIPEFKLANLVVDHDLLTLARREAFELVKQDPQLRRAENAGIRAHFELRYMEILALGQVG